MCIDLLSLSDNVRVSEYNGRRNISEVFLFLFFIITRKMAGKEVFKIIVIC
jgi:hypothetical protein